MDIFLSPYNRQSIANIGYHPVRIAFLVPLKDIEMYVKCNKINCSLWGGAINILIPYERIVEENNEIWTKAILSFAPDNMIVPNCCTEATQNSLREKFDLFHVETIDKFLSAERPRTIHFGTHIYSLLEQEKFYFNKEERKQVLFFDFKDSDYKSDLRYIATFGTLEGNKLPIIPSPYLRQDLPYDTYATILELKISQLSESAYLDYFLNWTEHKFNSLFDYTTISRERFSQKLIPQASRHLLEGAPLVILTNDCLEDYMLASDLKHKITNYLSTPIIININRKELKEEIDILSAFTKKSQFQYLNIFSLSCSEQAIDGFIENSNVNFQKLDIQRITDYLTSKWVFSCNSTELCTLQKHINLLLKKPQFFDSLDDDDYFVTEIAFSNYQIPYKPKLNNEYWSAGKITSEGLKFLTSGNKDENLFLMIPEVDDILYTLMCKKGIHPKETAIRRKMRAVSSYFNNFWDLDIFSTKELQQLFLELKSPSSEQFKTTNGLNHGDMCQIIKLVFPDNKIPIQLIDYFISQLIKKRILFRGLEICCPNCHLREWKLVDELKNQNVCSGCSENIKFNDINKTRWTYKLNRLFAESFDLTVFLTLMHLVGYRHQDLDKVIGYNFGFRAEIKNEDLVQRLKGKREIEFDFAIIKNGRIIIGESKQSPDDFTEEVITNDLEFAKHIDSDELVFSSIGNLAQLKQKVTEMKNLGNLKIMVLDENDLCYLSADLSHRLEAKVQRDKDLKDISVRREAFIEQFLMISKDRSRPEDAKMIGDYYDIH